MSGQRLARSNPFRVSRLHRLRYRLDGGWQSLLERLAQLNYRGALVGPEGSGKTTLLEELELRLEREGWNVVRLRLTRERRRLEVEDWRRLEQLGANDLVTVDGLEQLSWRGWRRLERLSRSAGGLVATSHRAFRLPVLRQHRTDPRLLEELVAELVGRQEARALRPELERLFAAHGGNLRECLLRLYDRWSAEARRSEHKASDAPPDCAASEPPSR